MFRMRSIRMADAEVQRILATLQKTGQPPCPSWTIGAAVRVIEGPFKGFVGKIEEIDLDGERLKLTVKVLGHDTPVGLHYSEVERRESPE